MKQPCCDLDTGDNGWTIKIMQASWALLECIEGTGVRLNNDPFELMNEVAGYQAL